MKIVFWSPVHGQARQSSNMLAIAFTLAMRKKYRILMTQTRFRMNNLEDAVVGRYGQEQQRERFYQDMGLDTLTRCMKRSRLEQPDMENCCVQILTEPKLLLLPGSGARSYEVYYEMLNGKIVYLLSEAEKYFDYVLADINPGADNISRQLLLAADIVVVNLSQNIGVLDSFFWHYPKELSGKKVFYLFGAYLSDSCLNLRNLRFRYGRIKRDNSGSVPLNVGFMDAVSLGKTVDYFETNLESEYGDSNYEFMRTVTATSERLIRLAA